MGNSFSVEDPYGTKHDLYIGKELQKRLLKLLEESPNRKMIVTEKTRKISKDNKSFKVNKLTGNDQLYEEVRLPPPRQFRDIPLPPEPFRDTIPPPDSVDNLLYHMYETVKEARWNDQHRLAMSQRKFSENSKKPVTRYKIDTYVFYKNSKLNFTVYFLIGLKKITWNQNTTKMMYTKN